MLGVPLPPIPALPTHVYLQSRESARAAARSLQDVGPIVNVSLRTFLWLLEYEFGPGSTSLMLPL